MQKNIIKKFLKIFIIVFIIVSTINIGFIVVKADENSDNIKDKNINTYKNIKTTNISKTGVAISINLGLRLGDDHKITKITMQKIFSAKESEENKSLTKEELITKNMLFTKQYYSILKTNFKDTIKNSENKEKTLNSIIEELKLRYDLGKKQAENLEKQRTVFLEEMKRIEINIEKIKENINSEFKKTNTKNINDSIDEYLNEKNRYYYFRTLVVFGDKFIKYYNGLNSYNKKLLDTLILNKDIISKGSYVVIPNNGNTILKEYGLLYDEENYKENIKNKKND